MISIFNHLNAGQEVLAALLFGQAVERSWIFDRTKLTGLYHIFTFSGFHVVFWKRLLRRVGYAFVDARRALWVECLLWCFLLVMHIVFAQTWPARRALTFQILLVMAGMHMTTPRRAIALHVSAMALLLCAEPSATHSMGVWMSISGSLFLSFFALAGEATWLAHALQSCVVTLVQFMIAAFFGITFLFIPAVALGPVVSILIDFSFGWLVVLFVASLTSTYVAVGVDALWCTFDDALGLVIRFSQGAGF